MSARSYMSIGDVLTLLRQEFPDVTISKIRFLESQGLVNPERTPSGYRKFYEHDVERLRWVLRQQREHFLPLKVIKDRLDDEGEEPTEAPEAPSGAARSVPAEEPVLVGQRTTGEGRPTPAPPRPADDVPSTAPAGGPTLPGIETAGAASNGRLTAPGAAAAHDGAHATAAGDTPAGDTPGGDTGSGETAAHVSAPGGAPRGSTADRAPAARRAPAAEGRASKGSRPSDGPARTPSDDTGRAAPRSRPRTAAPAAHTTVPPVSASGDRGTPSGPPPAGRTPPAPAPTVEAQGPVPAPSPTAREEAAPTGATLSLDELSTASGLDPAVVEELVGFGLVSGTTVAGQVYFDREALAVATVAAGFARFGVEPRHLRLYKNAAEREAGFVEQIVLPLVRQRNPEARVRARETVDELAQLGQQLRASLLRSALGNLLDG